jgi:hypothetical protein
MINYVKGNLFDVLPTTKVIMCPHVCNDIGGFGAGFAKAVAQQYPVVRDAYKRWYQDGITYNAEQKVPFELGMFQVVPVNYKVDTSETGLLCFVNMIAQHETIATSQEPIRYAALAKCMWDLGTYCNLEVGGQSKIEIYAPQFGAGLARGDWKIIERLIEEAWVERGIPTTVCIYP